MFSDISISGVKRKCSEKDKSGGRHVSEQECLVDVAERQKEKCQTENTDQSVQRTISGRTNVEANGLQQQRRATLGATAVNRKLRL